MRLVVLILSTEIIIDIGHQITSSGKKTSFAHVMNVFARILIFIGLLKTTGTHRTNWSGSKRSSYQQMLRITSSSVESQTGVCTEKQRHENEKSKAKQKFIHNERYWELEKKTKAQLFTSLFVRQKWISSECRAFSFLALSLSLSLLVNDKISSTIRFVRQTFVSQPMIKRSTCHFVELEEKELLAYVDRQWLFPC